MYTEIFERFKNGDVIIAVESEEVNDFLWQAEVHGIIWANGRLPTENVNWQDTLIGRSASIFGFVYHPVKSIFPRPGMCWSSLDYFTIKYHGRETIFWSNVKHPETCIMLAPQALEAILCPQK